MTGSTDESPADGFLARASGRIQRTVIVIFLLGSAPAWLRGKAFLYGFVLGSALAFLNFVWLKQSVKGLTEAVTDTNRPTGMSVAVRFFLRFALLGAAIAYATMNGSKINVYGVIAGLSLSVIALIVESLFEAFHLARPPYNT